MEHKFLIATWVLLLSLISGCFSRGPEYNAPCEERKALFCEDFEGIDPTLGGKQLVTSTAADQWWITGDDDQDDLFQGFPLFGRTRSNMILLSGGSYKERSSSFLYTREIDLTSATRASLGFNLIYRTEKHWDGLVVFAITDGIEGVKSSQNWVILTPLEGYPDSVLLNGFLLPGYSGISSGWIHQEVDLSSYLGQKLILGFYFVSDDYLGDWGIGLDDIVVEADAGSISDQSVGLTALAVDTLVFPQDSLISPDLPRANPLSGAACIGIDQDIPDLNDRAIIKALSESGEHILVLHPGVRSLCWVSQEDIWIDGDLSKLPQIAEKALDSYLPISSLGHSPVMSDSGCLTGNESSLPLRIQSALIENGKITTLLFDPILSSEADSPPIDPRVGSLEKYPALQPDFSLGGELWIGIGGTKKSCLIDWNYPGRVICQGLAMDVSQSMQFEVCWQGWDDTQSCPTGYFMNPTGTICIPANEVSDCSLSCDPGYTFDNQFKTCLIDKGEDALEEDHYACPPGFLFSPLVGRCQGQEYLTETNCPRGTYFAADDNQCLILGAGDGCPEGYRTLPDSKGCIPVNISTAAHCIAFDFQIPRSEVTVKESTRCLKDPGNPNQIVSSLKPFDSVEVLGLGEDGETLVVNNPDYHIPCWAPLEDFYLDKLDLEIQPIIYGEIAE